MPPIICSLRFVDAPRPREDKQRRVDAGRLDDAAPAGDVARQYGQPAVAEIGVFQIADAACRAVGVRCVVISPLCAQFPAVKACRGALSARCLAALLAVSLRRSRGHPMAWPSVRPSTLPTEVSSNPPPGKLAQDREDAARTVDIPGCGSASWGRPCRAPGPGAKGGRCPAS